MLWNGHILFEYCGIVKVVEWTYPSRVLRDCSSWGMVISVFYVPPIVHTRGVSEYNISLWHLYTVSVHGLVLEDIRLVNVGNIVGFDDDFLAKSTSLTQLFQTDQTNKYDG